MPADMSDRVPEDMPDRMPEDLPDRMPEDMPVNMPDHMPEDMPDRMPNRMSEDMSDRMPEDLPVRKCINVMVGITRSKVIYSNTASRHDKAIRQVHNFQVWSFFFWFSGEVKHVVHLIRWNLKAVSMPIGARLDCGPGVA